MSVQDDTGVNRNLKNQRGQLQDVPTEHRHEPPQPSRCHKGADKHGVSVACALVSCESLTILYALVSDQCHMRACVCAGSGCEATMTMLTKMPACSCSHDGQTPSRHLTLGGKEQKRKSARRMIKEEEEEIDEGGATLHTDHTPCYSPCSCSI